MKTKLLKLSAVLLILAGSVSCQKENTDSINFYEITIGSENPVINYVNNDIEFNFYLLNEQSEPSTVFNEGENFRFYFSATNNRDEKLYFDYGFLYDADPIFCRVYDAKGQDYGKPFNLAGENYISLEIYQFGSTQDFTFQTPWKDERTYWTWYSTNLATTNQNYLSKGIYYTEFEHDFVFRHTLNKDDNSLRTGKIKFKINFEIK